ncbi:ABC transporter ATP-binding protein/permease [Alsobacter sp. SYSU M60028]|uniref:ABC transporter ATP-binding protein/permease n=1 Tax=Alsobacter ponti TaxID=2962936 RepID=A0ABT1LLE7_9HYPH|nr:ABC transporter ATP-binding protein [Alsobacter ponti]MCP8941058.1 ABC transporter ATP-binding protein/permease [Alsobacter ponti]
MFRYFESLLIPTAMDAPGQPPQGMVAFYWFFARQVVWFLVALLVLGALIAATDAAIPVMIGWVVNAVATAENGRLSEQAWPILLAGAALVLVVRPLLAMAQSLLQFQAVFPGLTNLVRWQSHQHVVRQSIGYFQSDFAGRIASRVLETGYALRASLVSIISVVFYMVALVSMAIVLIARADLLLALPMVLWLALYVGLLAWLVPHVRRSATDVSYARSAVTGRIVDSYTNILTVKLFANGLIEDDQVRRSIDHHTGRMRVQMRWFTWLTIGLAVLSGLLIAGTGALALWLWGRGAIGLEMVATALPLTLQISGAASRVAFETTAIFEQFGTVHEGMETVAKPLRVTDRPEARPIAVTKGELVFERVSFHYGREGGVIDDFSLAIRPGEKIGLVGRSGAGKSTLVNLLLRFYDLQGGRILIDGQDCAFATQDSVRAQIAVVTQDTSLLHRSIRENIRYGRPTASEAEVEAAARRAHAHDFILELEDWSGRRGYDAHVGERGVKLSGGQRQRVAIARVILKNAPILILDEATSALDSEVEAAIQEQLETLMEGKTVICIAHRLSTIARMDRLVILDAGRIVEQGTHHQLLEKDGHYARLWRRQSGGFLGEE